MMCRQTVSRLMLSTLAISFFGSAMFVRAQDHAPGTKNPLERDEPPASTSPRNPLERDTPAPAGDAGTHDPSQARSHAPSGAARPGPIIMKLHTMSDPGTGGMPSHTVLAPDGWKVEGGAWWAPPNLFNILPTQDVKAIAPDGRQVHVGPSLGLVDYRPSQFALRQMGAKRPAEMSADNGRMVMYLPDNLQDWTTFYEEKCFRISIPQATNLRMEPVVVVPELTQVLHNQLRPLQEQAARNDRMLGGQMRSSIDGVVLAGTCFYELDGKKWEHLLMIGVTWTMTDSQTGRQISWAIEPSVSYRAEAGQLQDSMPLLMAIGNSIRMTPQWSQMRADHVAKMGQIAAKGAADRSAIIAQTGREINKIITDGFNERQAIQDRSNYNVIKSIRGVEDYTTGSGETPVQLPNNYDHIFSNGNGEYILTNDALYNPNTDPNVNNHTWNPMQAAK